MERVKKINVRISSYKNKHGDTVIRVVIPLELALLLESRRVDVRKHIRESMESLLTEVWEVDESKALESLQRVVEALRNLREEVYRVGECKAS